MALQLVRTCDACPEQYDVFKDTELVGYIRLRHGYFSVRVPNSSGQEIYSAYPKGDGLFKAEERNYYLKEAKKAIKEWLKNYKKFYGHKE